MRGLLPDEREALWRDSLGQHYHATDELVARLYARGLIAPQRVNLLDNGELWQRYTATAAGRLALRLDTAARARVGT